MPTIAANASAQISLAAGNRLRFLPTGDGVAVVGNSSVVSAGTTYDLGSIETTIGPFDGARIVSVSANRALDYELQSPPLDLYVSNGSQIVSRNPSAGSVSGIGGDLSFGRADGVPLRIITDTSQVTIAPTGGTVTSSIDLNSPYGVPALRLDIGVGVTQVDVTITGLRLPLFRAAPGRFSWDMWLADSRMISQAQSFYGTDSFALVTQATTNIANSGVYIANGQHIATVYPEIASADTVTNTDTVTSIRLRLARSSSPSSGLNIIGSGDAPSAVPTTVWVRGAYLPPARRKPFVILTADDADVRLFTRWRPLLRARGLRCTFGMNSGPVDGLGAGAAFLTRAQADAIYADGNDISSHAVSNTPFALATFNQYVRDVFTTRDLWASYGWTRRLDYHPLVQGIGNGALVDALRAGGISYIRSVNDRSHPEEYLGGGQLAMLPSFTWGSGKSLTDATTRLDQAISRQLDMVNMIHAIDNTSADTITWSQANAEGYLDYALGRLLAGQIGGIGSLSDYLRYISVE